MKSLVLALVAVLSAQSAMAMDVYTCSVKQHQNANWIAPKITISHDLKTNTVFVADRVILSVNRQPVEGKVSLYTDRKINFRWSFRAYDRSHNGFLGNYKASFNRKTGNVRVSMKPIGYGNSFSGKGTCEKTSE